MSGATTVKVTTDFNTQKTLSPWRSETATRHAYNEKIFFETIPSLREFYTTRITTALVGEALFRKLGLKDIVTFNLFRNFQILPGANAEENKTTIEGTIDASAVKNGATETITIKETVKKTVETNSAGVGGNAAETGKKVIEKGAEAVGELGEKAVETAAQAGHGVKKGIEKAVEKGAEKAGELGEKAVETAAQVGHGVKKGAEKVLEKGAEKAGELGEKAVETAAQAGHSVKKGAEKVLEKGAEAVGELGEKALETAAQAGHDVKKGIEKAVEKGAETVGELSGEAAGKVKDGVHKAIELGGEAAGKVKDGVHKAVELGGEAAGKVKDGVHKAVELGEKAAETTIETTKSLWDTFVTKPFNYVSDLGSSSWSSSYSFISENQSWMILAVEVAGTAAVINHLLAHSGLRNSNARTGISLALSTLIVTAGNHFIGANTDVNEIADLALRIGLFGFVAKKAAPVAQRVLAKAHDALYPLRRDYSYPLMVTEEIKVKIQ